MTFSTLASPGVSLQGGGGSGGGGGGTPGGSNTQIQYNSSGTFAGASGLTTNGTELTIASGTKTADAPVLNMSQTWNNTAVTFTGLRFNVPTDSSAAGSLLMDLQVGGISKFSVSKSGAVSVPGDNVASVSIGGLVFGAQVTGARVNGLLFMRGGSEFQLSNTNTFGWASANNSPGISDLFLGRRGAANLRLGAADAAAPVAQTLSVQSVVAGTSNTAGANLTITGSQGTGTGAGGSIVFQVAPAGSSGTAQNALATALTINSARQLLAETSSDAAPAFAFSGATGTGLSVRGSVGRLVQSGTAIAEFTASEFRLGGSQYFSWASNTSADPGAASDVRLYRDAANTLALRNGANPQTFNVYKSYTDASNYSRLAMYASGGGNFIISSQVAGTGAGGIMYVSNTTEHAINFQTNNSDRWTITGSGGHLLAGTDNLYDIGASGANRPRNLFLANNITIGGTNITSAAGGTWSQPSTLEMATGGHIRWASRSRVYSTADGVIALLDSTAAAGSSLEMSEMTAPAAPATNGVRIYAEDNGAGKTRLMARFATGAAVQIAIEP